MPRFADMFIDPDKDLRADPPSRGSERDTLLAFLRWVLMHMVEEYARHNGHADLLREAIDGSSGM